MMKLLDINKKILKEHNEIAEQIILLEDKYTNYSDTELQEQTSSFKERLSAGETLDDILIEAFAIVREASKRIKNEIPYKVQIIGGITMHKGDIAEMKTGEGKTLTATMPVYLNALEGKGVHVVTANEYLAERDAKSNGEIYRFLGLSVGVNKKGLSCKEKQDAYNCDITYTTASELGFDYLRDNMVKRIEDKVISRDLHFVLIDECDSILIDEARTPLIISGKSKESSHLYKEADDLIKKLKEERDYKVDVSDNTVVFTEEGISTITKLYPDIYSNDESDFLHYLTQALRAHTLYSRDIDYIVKDDGVLIVDPHTGRTMEGRQYSHGLHQAIATKEGVKIQQENKTMAMITYQNFFRLYAKIAGMTGTAITEEEEFLKVYNMRVIQIPTNKPIIRTDAPDKLFQTKAQKYTAIIRDVLEFHKTGRPILIGTVDIDTSELISHILHQNGIKHEVLNAKNHAKEARIIAKAGRYDAVTVATNMAGRGTDIKLSPDVVDLGGLVVIGTEKHESRRIDEQLRGRAGRQGDPGYSQFYVSKEDSLIEQYIPEKPEKSRLTKKDVRNSQRFIEGINYDVRMRLLDFDEIARKQRLTIYNERDKILQEDLNKTIRDFFAKCSKMVANEKGILLRLGIKVDTSNNDILTKDELFNLYEEKMKAVKDEKHIIEQQILLSVLDKEWAEHLDALDNLKQCVPLYSYGQDDILESYSREAFRMFNEMKDRIIVKTVKILNNMIIRS